LQAQLELLAQHSDLDTHLKEDGLKQDGGLKEDGLKEKQQEAEDTDVAA
jgi:hypothetical protein